MVGGRLTEDGLRTDGCYTTEFLLSADVGLVLWGLHSGSWLTEVTRGLHGGCSKDGRKGVEIGARRL